MVTTEAIKQFYKDIEAMGLVKPVSELAKASGLSSGNVSEYLSGKKRPSERLMKAFYDKIYKPSTNVPLETATQQGDPALVTLTGLLVQLMTTQNNILSQQKEEIVDRLKRMETNLEFVAGTSESIQFDMISERETVLRSLARIEKKSEEELLVIADKKKRSLAQIKGAPYKKAVSSR